MMEALQKYLKVGWDRQKHKHLFLTELFPNRPNTFNMSVETLKTISPTTNEPIVVRTGISAEELQELPKVATEAFLSFKKTTLEERQAIVKRALKLLGDKHEELAKELTEQMGRPIAYTAKEIATAVKRG